MYDTQNALIAHLEAAKAGLGLATVAAYSGQFSKANNIDDPLPAALTFFRTVESEKTHDRLQFSLLIVSENIALKRETGAISTMTTARCVYDWLQDNSIFSDLNFNFAISVRGDANTPPMTITPRLLTARHTVLEIEIVIYKHLTNKSYMLDRDLDYIEDRDGAFMTDRL